MISYGQCHTKRDLRTFHIVQTKISPYTMLKTPIHNKSVYKARKISAIDVMIVKKCRPWPDAASETRRLVWVYTFCMCPKVPFRMTLVNYRKPLTRFCLNHIILLLSFHRRDRIPESVDLHCNRDGFLWRWGWGYDFWIYFKSPVIGFYSV